MGFGGGYSAPEVGPVPEKQAVKSLSAGAQAAAEAQREKQRKNRGLTASILTSRAGVTGSGGLSGLSAGNGTLG